MKSRTVLAAIISLCFLLVLPAALPAQVENHPVGSHVTFYVTVDGFPAPTVEFFKDGKKFGEPVEVSPGTWHLVLGVIGKDAAGSYTAKATNSAGSGTSDPFVLTTNTPPAKPTIRIAVKPPGTLSVEVPAGTNVITTPVASPSSSAAGGAATKAKK